MNTLGNAARTGRTADRRSRRPVMAVLFLTGALLVAGCTRISPLIGVAGPGPAAPSSPGGSAPTRCALPGPGEEFQTADPSAVDLDPAAVADAIDYATQGLARSVRVYRNDCLVGRSGRDPDMEWVPQAAWSMTKGVVSIVTGAAVQQGLVEVDAPIGTYLSGLDAAHAAITLEQLLTQTSGLDFAWVNDLTLAGTADSAMLTLQRPFQFEPGTTFRYAQTTMTAIVAVVEAATGEDFQDYARRVVFHPIGIPDSDWTWARDGAGRSQGFAFLEMTSRSFARLGELLLHRGEWNGRQILSADFVTKGSKGTAANGCYGYLWWTNDGDTCGNSSFPAPVTYQRSLIPSAPRDLFALEGLFDQSVLVIPSLDMVVVRMGLPHDLVDDPRGQVAAQNPDWDYRFFRYLLTGLLDQRYVDPGDWVPDPPEPPVDWSLVFDPRFR